jgi:hypothetical protein
VDLSSPSDLGEICDRVFYSYLQHGFVDREKATLAYAYRMGYAMGVRAS